MPLVLKLCDKFNNTNTLRFNLFIMIKRIINMRNLIYIPIILLITIFAVSNNKIVSAQDKVILINDSLHGEKLLSSKEFMLSINSTCHDNSDLCTVTKIKKNYYLQFNGLTNDEITISKLKNDIELKLKKEKNQNQFFLKIELISYKNKVKVDSVICYEYLNDPSNVLATEKLYYLNNYYLWTLDFTYDLESTTADSWNKYKINTQSGKFELVDKLVSKY